MLIIVFSVLSALTLYLPAQASTTAENTSKHFENLQKRLIKDGFDANHIETLYNRPQVFFEGKGLTIFFTYSEAKLDYDQFTNEWSINRAKKFMQEYNNDLDQTENTYGVDKNVITAILLVESGLGSWVGKRYVLNTLSSMAVLSDPEARKILWDMIPESKRISRKKYEKSAARKSEWAYNELKAFLRYCSEQGFDPATILGSMAGAVGLAQFMPTSIVGYARDGNQDGTVDLHHHADAMASIANYLKSHGWRPGISREKKEKVIYYYNHSKYYVNAVLKIADLLEG